eukprot:TRINITY_DN14646_c0_g1_i2.p1 TRINITY_DN14646_c0_g1~~TRINITY_DN14646_c0_g1_i2.p1  ORF type:complete len:263 (+),score=58.07 TRINITY_DN14646_c0_g1_i2:48-791(+)
MITALRISRPALRIAAATTFSQHRHLSATPVIFADKKFGRETKVAKRQKIIKGDNTELEVEEVDELISSLKTQLRSAYSSAEKDIRQATRELITQSKSGTAGLMTLSVGGKPLSSMASVSGSGQRATVNVYLAANVAKVKSAIQETDEEYKPQLGSHPTTIEVTFPSMNREKRHRLAKSLPGRCAASRDNIEVVKRSVLRELAVLIKGIDQMHAHNTQASFKSISDNGDKSIKDLLQAGKTSIESTS